MLEGNLSEVGALFPRHIAPDKPTGEKKSPWNLWIFFLISLAFSVQSSPKLYTSVISFQIPGR